MMIDTYKIMNK